MAKRTAIGAIIKLDGEGVFRNSIQNCKNSVSAMKSELQTIIKSYEGNANSIEALSAVQEKYAEIQQRAKEQEEKMLTAYEKSSKKQDEVKESMQQMKDAYAAAQKKLQEMQESGTATAEALSEQEKATTDAYEAYLQYESAVEKAESRTAYFQKALADAKTEELEATEAIQKYSSYIEEANNSADGTASSIDAYGREVRDAGAAAREGGAGIAVFAGALGANIVTEGLEKAVDLLKQGVEYSVRVGSEFESSASKVKAVSGATAAEMAQINQMAKELGRTTNFSASQVEAGFSYMSQSGWKVSQQLAAMPGVVNLARAAETDLASSSAMVTNYLTAFGLEAEYAGQMADVLAYAMSHSNASVEEFGEAWKNSAANMNAANQSMETTTAILEALANNGRAGSEAGTSLKAVLRDITSKMKDGAISVGDASIAVEDANGNFRDLIDILGDVETATDGMGTAQRAAALSAIFTDDSISAVNMTLQEGVDNIRKYKTELENCDSAATDMADTMTDNLTGSMQNLDSAVEGLGNAAYNYIGGPLKSVVDGVTDAINDITDVLEPQVTEVTQFVDNVVEAVDKINSTISNADMDYAAGMSDAEAIQGYMDIMDKARSKTSLTEFEAFQLNNAIKALSGDIPELNEYVDDTGRLLGLSADGFEKIKNLVSKDYKKVLAEAVVNQRNAYAQAMADAEIVMRQTEAAKEAAAKEEDGIIKESFGNQSGIDILSMIVGNKWAQFEMLKPIMDAMSVTGDAEDAAKDAGEAYDEAAKKYNDYIDLFPKYSEELGIVQDENGNWIVSLDDAASATQDAADATEDAADSISDASGTIGSASEDMTDTVRAAVSTYIEETEKLKNADPADAIRDQLAAAAAEVQEFQNTMQSNLSSFSLFGDRSSLIDAYTSTNREEMRLNMSWALSSMKNYTEELDTLQKRGVSSDFIDYLTSQGQAGLNYVHSLALASDAELKQFQDSFSEYQSYVTGTNNSVQKLLTDYVQGISAGIADGYNSWHEFGIETTAGLFDAIDEATEAIKNGTISGDIQSALQVVLQNRADQIAAQNTSHQIDTARNERLMREAKGARQPSRAATTSSGNGDDLRIGGNNIVLNVTTHTTLDGKKISENSEKNAKIKAEITGRI